MTPVYDAERCKSDLYRSPPPRTTPTPAPTIRNLLVAFLWPLLNPSQICTQLP
jgi:hypothetical protein